MTHHALSLTLPDLPLSLVLGISAVLALVLAGWAVRRRAGRKPASGSPAVRVAALAALGCTAYSADTSWRFAADYLDMGSIVERAAMFATAELALFATALMARQNLATQGAPGLPGTLVWLITGVQIIPAYAEFGPVGGTVRALIGPVMAALLWHLAMGIELRLRTPGAASRGLLATLGREMRERLLSRLGIAARDRDAAQITRDRATARAVTLAARLAERAPERRDTWCGRRLTRRLSKAIGQAAVGSDPVQRAQLLDQLAVRRHAIDLASVALPSPWSRLQHPEEEGTVPSSTKVITATGPAFPDRGPHINSPSVGDRSPDLRGQVPGTAPASAHVVDPASGDREAGTVTARTAGKSPSPKTASTGPRRAKQQLAPPGTGDRPTPSRGPAPPGTGDRPAPTRGPTPPRTGDTRSPSGGSPPRNPRACGTGRGDRRRSGLRGNCRNPRSNSRERSFPMSRQYWNGTETNP
ncbi:hypothetical protein [Streptomyces sp. NPDC058991]|uniref:hypothetical protein n=1 Tax=unclassified Streptomyces TaxID=2593676 RepID=UPI0036C57D0F